VSRSSTTVQIPSAARSPASTSPARNDRDLPRPGIGPDPHGRRSVVIGGNVQLKLTQPADCRFPRFEVWRRGAWDSAGGP
jgi:hypothetical protein